MGEETLVDYMMKLQESADYLIRGGTLSNYETNTIIEIYFIYFSTNLQAKYYEE